MDNSHNLRDPYPSTNWNDDGDINTYHNTVVITIEYSSTHTNKYTPVYTLVHTFTDFHSDIHTTAKRNKFTSSAKPFP